MTARSHSDGSEGTKNEVKATLREHGRRPNQCMNSAGRGDKDQALREIAHEWGIGGAHMVYEKERRNNLALTMECIQVISFFRGF